MDGDGVVVGLRSGRECGGEVGMPQACTASLESNSLVKFSAAATERR